MLVWWEETGVSAGLRVWAGLLFASWTNVLWSGQATHCCSEKQSWIASDWGWHVLISCWCRVDYGWRWLPGQLSPHEIVQRRACLDLEAPPAQHVHPWCQGWVREGRSVPGQNASTQEGQCHFHAPLLGWHRSCGHTWCQCSSGCQLGAVMPICEALLNAKVAHRSGFGSRLCPAIGFVLASCWPACPVSSPEGSCGVEWVNPSTTLRTVRAPTPLSPPCCTCSGNVSHKNSTETAKAEHGELLGLGRGRWELTGGTCSGRRQPFGTVSFSHSHFCFWGLFPQDSVWLQPCNHRTIFCRPHGKTPGNTWSFHHEPVPCPSVHQDAWGQSPVTGNSITCPGGAALQRKGGWWKKGWKRCLAAKGTPGLVGFAQLMGPPPAGGSHGPSILSEGPEEGWSSSWSPHPIPALWV